MNGLDEPIKTLGIATVANACGVSERAVYKWLGNQALPKTEFYERGFPEKTNYAEKIESLSEGKYSAKEILELSKKNLFAVPPPQAA
ncbi:Uncharacterised protein [Serratia fonticola]|uniref:helix-turn-helix domain-containing protein n=1 Tax=Serratia fonticola TaxID=47917 RepID=UPI00217902DC|nr:helix-turn-helix domain-containing protein [Serratia fonticola]CAI1069902.1 Uncharacterised protein [Serratia fonticola]